jgi:alpha/beta superfamily hydrolase
VSKIRLTVAVLAAVSAFGAGGPFQVTNQATAAPAKSANLVAEPSSRRSGSATHVYLLRGFLNVFSLGMDSLAVELRRAGISATVANHTSWQQIADQIAADYKAGRRGPVVLIGHSFGADAVMAMGDYLGTMGVPVSLIIPFDGTSGHAASANVARVLNLYKNESSRIARGTGFHGEITNYYVSDGRITHMNIDDDPRLHAMVINRIRGTHNPVFTPAAKLG